MLDFILIGFLVFFYSFAITLGILLAKALVNRFKNRR